MRSKYTNFLIFFIFLRQSLTQSPRLECSGAFLAHCNFLLLGSSDSRPSASQAARTKGTHLIFCTFSRDGGFIMLARLVSNSWPQVIHLSPPPKVLGLQAWATAPGLLCNSLPDVQKSLTRQQAFRWKYVSSLSQESIKSMVGSNISVSTMVILDAPNTL